MSSQHTPGFGFWTGAVAGGALIYLFGTKQGRTFLQQCLDVSENIEDRVYEFMRSEEKTQPVMNTITDVLTRIQSALPLDEKK